MFFDNWAGIGRVLIVTLVAYLALILLLKFFGKRTLAKMTAFDFVVTVALGSILANIALSKNTVFLEGITALVVLIGAQYLISSFCVRSKKFEGWIKPEPTLLLYRGQFLQEAMRSERITEADILLGIRQRGHSSIENVEAVVLESDGSFNTILNGAASASDATLKNVRNYVLENQKAAPESSSQS
ncbi:DUF421 domain-containing protein [Nitrosococcus wardiae]|uniref:DUF421 domain-containing protein n=1 Tax=Nitrosococcus wardiae TaxID=1814290 RepID=A0A4P7C266_9GAMM|nr:YetF domain-containing protein [Nitrosococcus wardiae]QBQ55757.1 DUF421 domain-containing protein [Nitrosococcus wardiae]